VIGNIAEGLLGLRADAPRHALSTLSGLPAAVPWAELDHVPLGGHDIAVRQEKSATRLVHHSGSRPLKWTARFAGRHFLARVNGSPHPARVRTDAGRVISEVEVTVPVGRRTTVEI
jgi:hypothetical protein